MPAFQCSKCGRVDNTATGLGNILRRTKDLFDWSDVEEQYRGMHLCAEHAPARYRDGTSTEYGKWHNRFPIMYLPKNMFEEKNFNLVHKETGELYGEWVKRTGWDTSNEDKQ